MRAGSTLTFVQCNNTSNIRLFYKRVILNPECSGEDAVYPSYPGADTHDNTFTPSGRGNMSNSLRKSPGGWDGFKSWTSLL